MKRLVYNKGTMKVGKYVFTKKKPWMEYAKDVVYCYGFTGKEKLSVKDIRKFIFRELRALQEQQECLLQDGRYKEVGDYQETIQYVDENLLPNLLDYIKEKKAREEH